MISGVCPLSVSAMMAFTPGKWLAAYMAASAMVSSQRVNVSPRRWCECVVVGCFSAPRQTRAIAATASIGYWPEALSADSMTASV